MAVTLGKAWSIRAICVVLAGLSTFAQTTSQLPVTIEALADVPARVNTLPHEVRGVLSIGKGQPFTVKKGQRFLDGFRDHQADVFRVVAGIDQSSQTPPAQTGAKALYDIGGTGFVGVHYWFEDSRGQKFADPAAAGAGSKVALHLRGNVGAFLTVWMKDATHDSVELTTRTSPGPAGDWPGQRVANGEEFVTPEYVVAGSGQDATRLAIFLARSQTEQVISFAGALERLGWIAARKGADGASVIVREVDRTTAGQIGTYVVHRTGGQTGEEIVLRAK